MVSTEAKQLFEVVKNQIAPLFSVEVPLETQRETFAGMAAQAVIPEGITFEQVTYGSVPCEIVKPAKITSEKTVLYLHGGGHAMGSPTSYRSLTSRIAGEAGCAVYVPDFRLVPENPFPAGLEDAIETYKGMLSDGIRADKIVFGGDSSGGGLVVSLLLKLKELNLALPQSAFMYSPWTDITSSGDSFEGRSDLDPWLTPALMRNNADQFAGDTPKDDPILSPLFADLSDLPPMLIHVGTHEILHSDATRLAEKVTSVGGTVECKEWEELWHFFQFFAPALPEANQAIGETATFINN